MQEVRFNSTFTLQDYKKVAHFNVYGRSPLTIILCACVFLAGIFSLILRNIIGVPLVFAIIFTIYPFGLIFYCEHRITKNIKNRKIPNKEGQRITINENGLICIKEGKHDIYTWGDVDKVYEAKDYFIVYTKMHRIVTMIKRDINSDQEYTVRNLVINNMSYKNYRIQK